MNNQEFIQDLVIKATQGDVDAFQELYLKTRQKAYFVALSITKNEHDAQDILQESYLKAYQSLGQLEQPDRFAGWLNRIVANKAKNYIGRIKPDSFADYEDDNAINWQEETDPEFIPDESLDQTEAKALVAKLVQELPVDQRLVVLLHYFDDMEVTEVARALDVPEGTVKSRLSRARHKLAAMLRQAQSKGIQLYAMAPVPLLIYFIKLLGFEDNAGDRLPPLIGVAAAGGVAAGGAAAASSAGKASAGALTKGIAIAAATVLVAGGATASGVYIYRKALEQDSPPSQITLTNLASGVEVDGSEYTSRINPSEDVSAPTTVAAEEMTSEAATTKAAAKTTTKATTTAAATTTTAAATTTEIPTTMAAQTATTASPTTTAAKKTLSRRKKREQAARKKITAKPKTTTPETTKSMTTKTTATTKPMTKTTRMTTTKKFSHQHTQGEGFETNENKGPIVE